MSTQTTVDLKEVDYLANLSRVHLSDDEKKEMAGDLSNIIGFLKVIDQMDTEGLTPLYNVMEDHSNFLRKDEVKSSLPQSKIEPLTSHFQSGHFVVPQAVE